jgi:hypothetical protein
MQCRSPGGIGALVLLIVCFGLSLRLLAAREGNDTRPDTRARLPVTSSETTISRELLVGEALS